MVELNLIDKADPCPFCVWDRNREAKIGIAFMVGDCPCRWRNSSSREAHLDAVIHYFRKDMEKRLAKDS